MADFCFDLIIPQFFHFDLIDFLQNLRSWPQKQVPPYIYTIVLLKFWWFETGFERQHPVFSVSIHTESKWSRFWKWK